MSRLPASVITKWFLWLLTINAVLGRISNKIAPLEKDDVGILMPPEVPQMKCSTGTQVRLLNVLPGNGWDNLANEERGLTANREAYFLCRTSADGKLLIPDDMVVEPLKSSRIELSSEIFTHFTNYTSLTAFSVNIGSGAQFAGASISGDFSVEKESVRRSENANNGLTIRSQLRHRFFIVHQMPDSGLHPRLRNRLLDIAAHVERSNLTNANIDINPFMSKTLLTVAEIARLSQRVENTLDRANSDASVMQIVDAMRAAYLADLIVRDFGTHSIVSVEAGAVVAKVDSLKSSSRSLTAEDKLEVQASASASFGDFFNYKNKAGIKISDQQMDRYERMVASSTVLSHGGPAIRSDDTNISRWESDLEGNLVAIDRMGRPIYDLITPRILPELSETIALRLAGVIKAAVGRYYSANLVVGCLDPKSPYYDSDANVPADSCYEPSTGSDDEETTQLPFGGAFDTCYGPADLCKQYLVPNPSTGMASCPSGYIDVNLLPPQVRTCAKKCESTGFFSKPVCHNECAVTKTYWCAVNVTNGTSASPKDLGFLFGGLYTDTSENPLTSSQSCPMYYQALTLGRRLRVCVSSDREFGQRFALKFGGFYACQSGNPLIDVLSSEANPKGVKKFRKSQTLYEDVNKDKVDTSSWPKHCPSGYTSHLASVEDTCQINYCIPANSLKVAKDKRLKRPPFIQLPELSETGVVYDMPQTFHDSRGRVMRYDHGTWKESTRFSEELNYRNPWFISGILMLTVFMVFIISTATFLGVRRFRVQRDHHRGRASIPSTLSAA